jgi:hypothetical protein
MKYTIAALLFFSACGPAGQSATKLPGGPDAPSVIAVSLDDAFTTVTPNGSEKVELTDARYFTPPSALNIVQGSYAGSNPGQYLHARLYVGAEQCEYQANGIGLTVLSLQFCSGGIGANTYLASGTEIELNNNDCPGFLVQANFNLVR